MKKYFYCNANFTVYTENEKNNSRLPACRFEEIGTFKNRTEAMNACKFEVTDAKRI